MGESRETRTAGSGEASKPIATETTVHIFELTDPGQIEAARSMTDYGKDVPVRAAVLMFTTVDPAGNLVLVAPAPGYSVWLRPTENFNELFAELGGLATPISIPWSQAPEWVTIESPVDEIGSTGVGPSVHVVPPTEMAIVVPLDWKEE